MELTEQSDIQDIVEVLMDAEKTADGPTVFTRWHHAAEAIHAAGYRKVDGYEYAIQYHDTLRGEWTIAGQYLGNAMEPAYWGELEERETVIDEFRLDYPNITFVMLKRAKAGKVWYA